jgi:hypothetical protein
MPQVRQPEEPMTKETTNDEPPSGVDDVEVSERMIRCGVKDLTHALDRGDITLGQAVASIYRTMERVRRRDAENEK